AITTYRLQLNGSQFASSGSHPKDNGPIPNRKPTTFSPGGSPTDNKQTPNLQYNNPTRLYTNNNADPSLPLQMSGLHITSSQSVKPFKVKSYLHYLLGEPNYWTCNGQLTSLLFLSSADSLRSLPRNRNGIDTDSDVYKMLQDYERPVSEPKQSGSFRYLQGMLEAGENGEKHDRLTSPRHVKSPVSKLGGALSGLQMLPECTRCGNGIVGTIVKARDKLYHPECFMCDDCGLNLKQRGYFFIEEQLYCETHAKERVKPPEGYDVVAVYPNAKVELV
ncbi:hypothetical protein lerEdw1_016263, partial [Lerista edwardsae]